MFHYVHNMVANFVHLLLGAWQMCGACIMNGWRDIEGFLLKTAACLSKTTLMRQCISKEVVLLLVCACLCLHLLITLSVCVDLSVGLFQATYGM